MQEQKEDNYKKDFYKFFSNRPNKLVAYVCFLVFIIIGYYLSGETGLLAFGFGAALASLPQFKD